MDELIYKQPLLNAMDKRYNEKVNIVPDNLAEGFFQMEKLIKEQPVITKQQIEEEAINRFVATLIPRLTDAIYPKDIESMTNLIKGVASEVRGNDNEFFNFDSPVVNVDQKSYLKGYSQGLADKGEDMDKARKEGIKQKQYYNKNKCIYLPKADKNTIFCEYCDYRTKEDKNE